MALDLAQYLTEFKTKIGGRFAVMMQNVQDAVNQSANAVGVDATQHLEPPDPPNAINVKAAGGMAHVTLNDNTQRSRALHYFVEYSTDPNFFNPAPHVEPLGPTRSKVLALPNKDDNGAAQMWHFRAYSMQLSSRTPSDHVVFGGSTNPTPVDVGGDTSLTLLPSTGAGTASSTGQEAGQGFGHAQYSQANQKTATKDV